MGRLGLDPSTLRPSQGRPQASLSVHLSWSNRSESSPASVEVSSSLLFRLQNWLHELDFELVGIIRNDDSDGRITETIVNTQRQ